MVDWTNREFFRIAKEIGERAVVLYGAGKYGRVALENIKKHFPNLNIKYFIDDNKVRNRNPWGGVQIVSLKEAMETLGQNFCIIITNYYVSSVLQRLEECGFDLSKVYFCNEVLIEDIDISYIRENEERLQEIYCMLEDYQSKVIYRTMAESRFTKNLDVLCRTCDKNQYFPDGIFHIGDNEVLVDAGAFDGDTIEQFLKMKNQKYRYIYAFEPDVTNYERLQKKRHERNIKVFNAGLWDQTKTTCFSANKGGSSKIEESGEDTIQVYRFDELELPEKEVTFVKMDIEGSELKALEGMRNTITTYKPKLAICIYHKFEDLWELPLYIKGLVPEYKLYIRNYTTYMDEIVLYATL